MQWLDVPGFPGYRLNDDGEIWSSLNGKPKKMKFRLCRRKAQIVFWLNGKRNYFRVGPLMLTLFVGPRPTGMQCCHWDGNAMNNRLDNLRWGTHADNAQDSIRLGVFAVGSRHGLSRLIESDILSIRQQALEGFAIKQIARNYKVDPHTIRDIVQGKTWRHV